MEKIIAGLLILFCCLVCLQPVNAQQKKKRAGKSREATTNTGYNTRGKDRKTTKEYLYLYRNSSRGLLQGNKCVEDYTEKMGFRYIVMPPGQEGSLTDSEMRLHNFGVKFVLLIKNGPFWHQRVNKKIRNCREKTGDYMG